MRAPEQPTNQDSPIFGSKSAAGGDRYKNCNGCFVLLTYISLFKVVFKFVAISKIIHVPFSDCYAHYNCTKLYAKTNYRDRAHRK